MSSKGRDGSNLVTQSRSAEGFYSCEIEPRWEPRSVSRLKRDAPVHDQVPGTKLGSGDGLPSPVWLGHPLEAVRLAWQVPVLSERQLFPFLSFSLIGTSQHLALQITERRSKETVGTYSSSGIDIHPSSLPSSSMVWCEEAGFLGWTTWSGGDVKVRGTVH